MYLTLIIYLLLLQESYSNFNLNYIQSEESLKQCLLDIVIKSTKPEDSIAIGEDDSYPFLFSGIVQSGFSKRWTFIQNSITTIELRGLTNSHHLKNSLSLFLIQVKNVASLNSILENLKSNSIFNARAKFLVTSTTIFENTTSTLSSIFKSLWQVNIYNSLVVLPSTVNSSKTNVFTWYPYGRRQCTKDFTKFRRIDRCYKGQLQKDQFLYPDKIPDKLGNCPVKVRTVVWPPFVMQPMKRINNTDKYVFKDGFEIVLMNTIADSMHLNLTYTLSEKPLNWGEVYENGTATGMQAYLIEDEGDVGISSQGYTSDKLKFLDFGEPYFFEHLVWCVPHAETIPGSEKIVDVFSIGSWAVLFSVFIVSILLIWRLSRLNSENSSYRNFVNCFQNVLGLLLGVPTFPFPRTNSVRVVFCFWIIFTMQLNIVYKTSLVSKLTNPVYENQMQTLEEILNSNLRLQFMPTMKRHFEEHQKHSNKILKRWIDCIDLNDCMDRVAYTRDSVILLPKLYLEFVEIRYKKSKGSYIYCFNANILTYPGSMAMRKGFPLRDRMNSLISRIVSAGLVDHWLKDSLRINLVFNKTSILARGEKQGVIRFKEQKPTFYYLILGLILATFAFICEIFVSKYYRTYSIPYNN